LITYLSKVIIALIYVGMRPNATSEVKFMSCPTQTAKWLILYWFKLPKRNWYSNSWKAKWIRWLRNLEKILKKNRNNIIS
jgi:hypothetical protein